VYPWLKRVFAAFVMCRYLLLLERACLLPGSLFSVRTAAVCWYWEIEKRNGKGERSLLEAKKEVGMLGGIFFI